MPARENVVGARQCRTMLLEIAPLMKFSPEQFSTFVQVHDSGGAAYPVLRRRRLWGNLSLRGQVEPLIVFWQDTPRKSSSLPERKRSSRSEARFPLSFGISSTVHIIGSSFVSLINIRGCYRFVIVFINVPIPHHSL